MAAPTVGARLARRLIAFCGDPAVREALEEAVPEGWEIRFARKVADVGEFHDVLLHRFALLDLDERESFDPVATLEEIRSELMLNIPVFCFGGDPAARDAARGSRADRFFERSEVALLLPRICAQFDW